MEPFWYNVLSFATVYILALIGILKYIDYLAIKEANDSLEYKILHDRVLGKDSIKLPDNCKVEAIPEYIWTTTTTTTYKYNKDFRKCKKVPKLRG